MQPEIIDLSRYRMEKAKADMAASEILLNEGLFDQSLNRSYYAIFHSVRSLLALDQFDSRKHSGIIAYFNRNYVSPGTLDREYSKIIMGAERMRNKSDYDDFFVVSKADAENQIKNAKKFITAIESIIAVKMNCSS